MVTTGSIPNSFDMDRAGELDERTRSLVSRRRAILGPAYKLFYDRPIEVVRGEGVYLYDRSGTRYLDAYNNVPCVGHCHPRVVEAVARQAATLNTNTRYLAEPILTYAERLLGTHDAALSNVMFACTGSEATDLALRMARHATGGTGVVVTEHAYHGVTAAAAEVSPSLGERAPLGIGVRTVRVPQEGDDPARAGVCFGQRVSAALADLRRHGIKPAAVLMDTIFSSDGIVPEPVGFLKPVVEAAREAGALFVADEVQAGFGRTGEAMWGYQRHGVSPDLVTMGKPMGNGLPISGVAARADLVERFGEDVRYFNTFGANSVSIAAAATVLDVIEEEHLVENARVVGVHLREGLSRLATHHDVLRGVRGAGLYVAADVVEPGRDVPDPDLATQIVNGMRQRGVLISTTGPGGHSLKIRPPLPFRFEHADELLEALDGVLTAA